MNRSDELTNKFARSQGWKQPTEPEPLIEHIAQWINWDGGCEATDGCWVEPDGVCPHDHASWALYLRLL